MSFISFAKKNLVLILYTVFFSTGSIFSQSQFQLFIQRVNSLPDSVSKAAVVDSFFTYAKSYGIPFIEDNTANYIYRGPYNTVEITGDFDEFSPFWQLDRLTGTDLFYYSAQYELNARLDYEFRINGSVITNDPENPDSIPGYYGYHSELAMPQYIQPWEIEFNQNTPHGTVIDASILSNIVNRTYQLKIYLPPGYSSSSENYPVAYFQDGFSYIEWGSAINVLDNIIEKNLITPIIAVFVKPNDRNQEYAFGLRNDYQLFFVNELVPLIDSNYRTIRTPSNRLVLGDSYGGNISALIAYNHPDIFGLLGLHSAALDPNNYEAYNLFVNGEVKNIKISTLWGSYDNRNYRLSLFKNAIISKGYQTDWMVLPEGHSWGFWRATIDTMLQYFFPPQVQGLFEVTVNTNPDGSNFNVDGQDYSTTQIFNWEKGSNHTITTDSVQNIQQGTRNTFINWSDGGSITHTISIESNFSLTANFLTEHLLTIPEVPGGIVSPASGWFSADSLIQIQAIPANGFYFASWTGSGNGSYTGTDNPITININGPIEQLATFNLIPINPPTNLVGRLNYDPFSIELSWDDKSDNEDGFIIERTSGNTFSVIDSVGQNVTSYIDYNIDSSIFKYRIKAYNQFNNSIYSDTLDFYNYSGIKEKKENFSTHIYELYQNYPNPFNLTTKIKFSIPSLSQNGVVTVHLKVYDIMGNEVADLLNNNLTAGMYEVEFNTENLTSGVYFYKLQTGSFSKIKKMVLLK